MMKKRFSSLVSSFHGSCKSKEETSTSALPPIFYISPARRRMAAPAVVEKAGCRCVPHERRSSPAIDADDMSRARETPAYLWRKEEKWHVVLCSEELERTMLQEEDDEHEHEDAPSSTITELTDTRPMVLQRRKRECKRLRSRISTSSHDTTSCCFSSEDEANDEREDDYYEEEEDEEEEEYEVDETNTLLSSLSFASNSTARRPGCPASAVGALRRLAAAPCGTDEGKVQQESFAVVKRSSDPRGDFRRSMAEMVVEKGMYEAADLEQLLRCFLSLNSRHHHRAVVSAFTDIWQALFPHASPNLIQLQQVVNN